MTINKQNIEDAITGRLKSRIDIEREGGSSYTKDLVSAIVNEIIDEILNNGRVVNITSSGIGNNGSPVKSTQDTEGRIT
jgi:hypothetical protein